MPHSQIDDYIESFQEFRKDILGGNLKGARHAWRAIAKYKNTLLVHQGAAIEKVQEDDLEEARKFAKNGNNPFFYDRDWFVIDEAFVIKAWAAGVFRHGFEFAEDAYHTDEAMQHAHYDCINQG